MSESYQDGYISGVKDAESGAAFLPPNAKCPYDGRTKAGREWSEGYIEGYELTESMKSERSEDEPPSVFRCDCGCWMLERDRSRCNTFRVSQTARGHMAGSTLTLCPKCSPGQ